MLTTGALDEHLDGFGDTATASTQSRRGAEEQQQRVLESPLPTRVREALAAHAAPLLETGPVVVRSSAVGEDGAAESFAGQLDSILDVADGVQLERAVRDVWASLWSERAEFYRRARGVPMRGMGVVVQRQVDARVAGVMFTSTSSGEMLVEYGAGLADKLVAGEVDPGRVAIDRATGASRQLRRSDEGSLGERQLEQLRLAGLAAEAEFGAAQDVEWAIDGSGSLYVVQSRPITAPVTIPAVAAANGRRISWSNANVNENFPRPISPLLYSIASAGYTHYFRNLAVACGVSPARVRAMEPAFQQIIGVHGARMYYNLTSIHSVLRLAPFGDALTKSFDAFVGADGGAVEASALARRGKVRQASEVAVIAARATTLLFQIGRRIERFEHTVDDFAARAEPSRVERMSLRRTARNAGRVHRASLPQMAGRFVRRRVRRWSATAGSSGCCAAWGSAPACTRRSSRPSRMW